MCCRLVVRCVAVAGVLALCGAAGVAAEPAVLRPGDAVALRRPTYTRAAGSHFAHLQVSLPGRIADPDDATVIDVGDGACKDSCGAPCLLEGGQQNREQDGDDADNNQQFNQRKAASKA